MNNEKHLGIYHPNLSDEKLQEFRSQGFDAIVLLTGYFFEKYKDASLSTEVKQRYTAIDMKQKYFLAKRLGYKFFVVDFGWGLGKEDGNFFYQYIYDAFRSCLDVVFYSGEPIVSYVEEEKNFPFAIRGLKITRMKNIIYEKVKMVGGWGNFLMDETARNIKELINVFAIESCNVALSSYWNQKKYWMKGMSHAWIYGQLKIGGSLRYKALAKKLNELNVPNRFLYQGDLPVWDWFGWLINVLRFWGLKEFFERWMRKRFIKAMRG